MVFGSFARIKSQNYKHAKSSGFSEKIARQVALKPHLNIGVFALEENALIGSLAKKFKNCIKSRKNLGIRTDCNEYAIYMMTIDREILPLIVIGQ